MRELSISSKYKVKIRSNHIFCQKKRPPRANPRRSENPLFMRFISDHSMIEATLPEPTVLPPSRYQTGVLLCANGDFSCDLWRKIRIFHCFRVVFGNFVIMVLSYYFFHYSLIVLSLLALFSQVYFYNIYPLIFPLYLVSFLLTKHHFL